MTPDTLLAHVRTVLTSEAQSIQRLANDVSLQGDAWTAVCSLIRTRCGEERTGRLVVTGVGKAGHIGRKLAATFASTGTPSLFMHPTEARHGDLGMVQAADVVLAISNSGSSEEVVAILPSLKQIGCHLIALVGRVDSPLARHADLMLSIGSVVEACPLGLAPSTSTTALLAMGDAIALTVQRLRDFTPEQYARYHPGGALGRRLMTCAEAMRSGERVPTVLSSTPVLAALKAITSARAGSVLVIDANRRLLGIFTDGDLRRAVMQGGDAGAVLHSGVGTFATMPCRSVRADELVQTALRLCSERKINELPVIDATGVLVGLLDVQDLVNRGFEAGP